MNVFVIPSWYPSEESPTLGIFIKEQTELLGESYQNHINIGISLWGQNNNSYLLYAKNGFANINKILKANTASTVSVIAPNVKLYQKPTFTWTRKLLRGNLHQVVKSNLHNLCKFEADFGNIDLIHAHVGYPAGRIALEIARKKSIPFIITEHLIPFPSKYDVNRKGKINKFYLSSFNESSANIAVSPYLADLMKSKGIKKIKVIPNFISEDFFKPYTNSGDTDRTQFTFLFVGDLIHRKGVDLLLLALKEVLQDKKNIRCRICGSGKEETSYFKIADELGISHSIDWLGEVDREAVCKEMNQADVFLMPSRDESMGVVYIEALACGKPIIATRCGGPDGIVTSFNGLLVEKDNPKALAQAMLHMINNKEEYQPQVIRQDFLDRFSSQAIIPKLYNLYKEIIKNNESLI